MQFMQTTRPSFSPSESREAKKKQNKLHNITRRITTEEGYHHCHQIIEKQKLLKFSRNLFLLMRIEVNNLINVRLTQLSLS